MFVLGGEGAEIYNVSSYCHPYSKQRYHSHALHLQSILYTIIFMYILSVLLSVLAYAIAPYASVYTQIFLDSHFSFCYNTPCHP